VIPFKVVLVEPEIPWNTGNIGRSCLGFGAELHLVGKLGFSLDQKNVRRSGLDYWEKVPLSLHPDPRRFFEENPPDRKFFFFSARARRSFWDEEIPTGASFVFGRESDGLPVWIKRRFSPRFFRLPTFNAIRSLNLSTTAGIVLAEARRQHRRS
jgi:tRNA (cytidine/uridine-2'-O-)-methyltransferase